MDSFGGLVLQPPAETPLITLYLSFEKLEYNFYHYLLYLIHDQVLFN